MSLNSIPFSSEAAASPLGQDQVAASDRNNGSAFKMPTHSTVDN